jgi:hypothetical protein
MTTNSENEPNIQSNAFERAEVCISMLLTILKGKTAL